MLREKWTHVSDLLTAVIIRVTISETWANIYETWPNIPEDSIFTAIPVYILVQCLLSVQSSYKRVSKVQVNYSLAFIRTKNEPWSEY
jgi:hypothetical protein